MAQNRRIPSRLHDIRGRHWTAFKAKLEKVKGGGIRQMRIVEGPNGLIAQSKELSRTRKLTSEKVGHFAACIIEQAAFMADNVEQAGRLTGKKKNWNAFFDFYLTRWEMMAPLKVRQKIKSRTNHK